MNKQTAQIMFVVLAVALFGLVLAACGGSDIARTVPGGAKPGDLRLEPCKFKTNSGQVAADCGTLVMPENPDKADSRLIALPVIRIRAIGGSPAEPIFLLGGGPGSSNMDFKPPPALFANHDLVMVGYRGADGSSVLDCPEHGKALRLSNPLSDQSLAKQGEALGQCAARLQAEGVDLDGYTMLEVVADMEAARAGLGYERVNLLSMSYGTRIAQIYAYLHPDRLYRSVMMGVNPPGHFVWEPDTIDAQLEYFAGLCAKDAGCSARTPDLAETMRTVAHNMPRRWLFLPIDADKVKILTFSLLFDRAITVAVFDAYLAAEQGDPSGLALFPLAYDLMLPSLLIWGEAASKAVSADYDPSRDYIAEMDPPGAILGSPVSKLQWGSLPVGGWPTKPLPAEFRQVQPSDVQTLLVSGSIDFLTPAEFATDELLPHLTNGKQIILAEMGHVADVWGLQPEATVRLLTSFYDTGVADDSLYTYAPMDFGVSLGAPTLAKIILGVVVLIVAAVVSVIWFVARRVQRRTARRRSQDAA